MSIALMTHVWRMDLPSSEKMVLLALADAANDDGVTWLAVVSKQAGKLDLIKKTSLSERTVQRAIQTLCEMGLLQREERAGRGVLYTVTLDQPPSPRHPRHSDTPVTMTPTPVTMTPKPLTNPHLSSLPTRDPDGFAEFWTAYPVKKSKPQAERAYRKALARTDHGTLIASLNAQRTWPSWRDGFIPHAATWLNNDRWADEPDPSPRPSGRSGPEGNRPKPTGMAEIIARRRADSAGQVDVPPEWRVISGGDTL